MAIVTPGVQPASALLASGPSPWLRRWGAFAASCRFADLPADVVDASKRVLLDSIGAIAAGMQEPECRALAARLAATGGGDTTVVGSAVRLPGGLAAFLGGTAGTMLEIDEGNQYARGHPGIHVVPAVLAAAERHGASGEAVIVAIALGYEIGARIGIASKLRVTMHPHGTWGTVGAAVAVASLDGADAETMVETINVASSLGLATSRRTMLEGGTVRNAYAGVSNELGLRAVDLVAAGFTGEADGVATVFGTVAASDFDPGAMVEALGERWEIARNYFKRHAACRYTHGALDALAAIVAEAGGALAPEAIATIAVETYVWAAQLDTPEPRNMLAAKFSLPFTLATAIVHRGASLDAFRADARADATVRALARRIRVDEDPALTAKLPGLRPARVTITLTDGRVLRHEVSTNRGDTEDPYTPAEVEAKFHEVAGPVFGAERSRALVDRIATLETEASLTDFCRCLAVSA
jgi:2-methylcitrate dehydratase PrpD